MWQPKNPVHEDVGSGLALVKELLSGAQLIDDLSLG